MGNMLFAVTDHDAVFDADTGLAVCARPGGFELTHG